MIVYYLMMGNVAIVSAKPVAVIIRLGCSASLFLIHISSYLHPLLIALQNAEILMAAYTVYLFHHLLPIEHSKCIPLHRRQCHPRDF